MDARDHDAGERPCRGRGPHGRAPTELFSEAAADLRKYARGVLGIADTKPPPEEEQQEEEGPELPLRERGADLLRRSADVHAEEDAHPAYERILEQLAPDEGGPPPARAEGAAAVGRRARRLAAGGHGVGADRARPDHDRGPRPAAVASTGSTPTSTTSSGSD